MSSDDEPDYMSDEFLKQCVPDIRPGLVTGPAARKLNAETKQKAADNKSKLKPLKQREAESREEGLQKSISSDNKGFALLQKMGYKPGMAIGKKGQGRSEPVPIEIKTGRGGLGKETDTKNRMEQKMAACRARQRIRAQQETSLRSDFRQRMAGNQAEREISKDLYKSQRVCEQLDMDRMGLEYPDEKFYWTTRFQQRHDNDEEEQEEEIEEEEEEDDEISDEEKLQMLTRYLRSTYFYCVWCGTSYDDDKDLSENCPGPTNDDHS